MTPGRRLTELASLGAVAVLFVIHCAQLASSRLPFWHLAVLPLAWILADLISGIVHWTADTWGSESTPVIGARFIKPFRDHHDNADDIVTRAFSDLNGDVALGVLPILAVAFLGSTPVRSFLVALAFCLLPTNQIHQWAHQSKPPRIARALQRLGLILDPEEHRLHHSAPFRSHFCITTGWCNHLLTGRMRRSQ